MPSNNYYQSLVSQITRRSVEGTVSILGISNTALREYLVRELSGEGGNKGFLSDPVFEAMFPWESANLTMGALAGKLLQPSLIDAMDGAGGHRFARDWAPFKHQLQAWRVLINEDVKSVIVTSGTGSGKTECFMVPILNDLVSEYEATSESLCGVRALFIYPLNALINSQRERLRAWTDAFDGGVRFCLYNGNTEENRHWDQGKVANEILTRKMMRDTPAPILVTNATMLEYMLVRQIDDPIVRKSQGLLRWIVLDEAHSYIGSQAAELSLLLRRVMHAFGVEAANVRFVATSATIGDKEAETQLRRYLASLAGIGESQIEVIGGRRVVPGLTDLPPNQLSCEKINAIDEHVSCSESRYRALEANPVARKLRAILADGKTPQTVTQLGKQLFGKEDQDKAVLAWLDLCSNTLKPGPGLKKPEELAKPFLPLRGHLFHQVLNGLWCCANKYCQGKKDTSLAESWPFGKVYTQRRNHCECGGPVFELIFCNECTEPHLLALDKNGHLLQVDRESVDEFSLDIEQSEEMEVDAVATELFSKAVIAPRADQDLTYPVSISPDRLMVSPGMESVDLDLLNPESLVCVNCTYPGYRSPFYRRSLLGTPFYISNTVPTILDACQESANPNDCPHRGQRLITFTDSRQGTARISAKMQQDSERDSVRGLIYGVTANKILSMDVEDAKNREEKLDEYRSKAIKYAALQEPELAKDFEIQAKKIETELAQLGTIRPVTWDEAVNHLQSSTDLSRWILHYYRTKNPALFMEAGGARVLAEMLLLREFVRRPKRQNSMETLGLVSVQYPAIKAIKYVPREWASLNLTLMEWRDFLKVVLDFFIRDNYILEVPDDWINWMGAKVYPKLVLSPSSDEGKGKNARVHKWPQVLKGRNNRLVRLLTTACNLDLQSPSDVDLINGVMRAAWQALTATYSMSCGNGQMENRQILRPVPGSVQFRLDKREIAFQACTEALVCPFTHKLIDLAFKGLSPYLPNNIDKEKALCRKVSVPVCQLDTQNFNSEMERKLAVQAWVNGQYGIASLRAENLWTDVSDRILEGSKFLRAAEHSAQQPASVLEQYEAGFKAGKLNILSCSTTMEMGVDIGGISAVAMNNVPPHPANYLQRAGRAGRRGETQALAFTICKDNPHERNVFDNPLWPFVTPIKAPYITLSSDQIVQRHINSLLLAHYLKEVLVVTQTAITSLTCEWFLVANPKEDAPIEMMLRWLRGLQQTNPPERLAIGIRQVTRGSALGSHSLIQILDRAIDRLQRVKERWLPAYEAIVLELVKNSHLGAKDPFRRKLEFDLKSLGTGYLLSELASKAFLPGYGFPTGVVSFDHYSIDDYKNGRYQNKKAGRIDNLTRMRERPSREMSVAIREYAPGASVVLDGLVYRSAGILLNPFAPGEDFTNPQRLLVEWRCHSCGAIGNEAGTTFSSHCADCGTELKPENIKNYLEPLGFAVDFYSNPTTDISTQTYISAQEPWVSADSPLNQLFEPKLGSYRSSSQGHIFYHSSGEFGQGFAVCLRCGKSDSMQENGDYPFELEPKKPHKKLQGKGGADADAWCEGADESYAIKEGLHLGATSQTDIFELYLKSPKENKFLTHSKGDPLPWTLAVVLRQALADIHGISADEMGYTVKPTKLEGSENGVAGIVLFDKIGGGAGFSSSAVFHIPELFKRSLQYLECPEKCDSACQACLMGYDTRFHTDLLNRHVAREYIESIGSYLSLPSDAKILGEGTQYCHESLPAELLGAQGTEPGTLRLFVGGDPKLWDFSSAGLKDACLQWRQTFPKMELVIPEGALSQISEVDKEDLQALQRFGVGLGLVDTKFIEVIGGRLLAQAITGEIVTTFATTAENANVPNSDWWNFEGNYLVKSKALKEIPVTSLAKALIATFTGKGDAEVEVMNECDGPVTRFGNRLWESICNGSELFTATLNSGESLSSLTYSDCYICSPWSLILVAEIIDGLKQRLADRWDSPKINILTAYKGSKGEGGKGLKMDWTDDGIRQSVIEEYFIQMGEAVQVRISSTWDLPHGRPLILEWRDGTTSTVRFDHGVGCWSPSGSGHWFDVKALPKTQVEEMFKRIRSTDVRFSKTQATQIFTKKR